MSSQEERGREEANPPPKVEPQGHARDYQDTTLERGGIGTDDPRERAGRDAPRHPEPAEPYQRRRKS